MSYLCCVKNVLTIFLCVLLCQPMAGQILTRRSNGSYRFEPLLDRLYKFARIIPQEKVYIHMDNTCYFQGEKRHLSAWGKPNLRERKVTST